VVKKLSDLNVHGGGKKEFSDVKDGITLTPALSLREREKSRPALDLPQGEGKKQSRARSVPSPWGRGLG